MSTLYLLPMLLTMTFGIASNSFLVFVILRMNTVCKRKISPVQVLLLHTCFADMLFAGLSLGSEVVIIIYHPYFGGPSWLCRITRYLQILPLYASPFLLVAMSADRFQAICRPFVHYRQHQIRGANSLAIIAWLGAVICSIPQLFIWYKTSNGICATIYGADISILKSLYVISFNTVAWLLPSILSAFFNYLVCKTIWASYRSTHQMKDYEKEKSDCAYSKQTKLYLTRIHSDAGHQSRQLSEYDRKRNHAVKITLTIVLINFILWAPFCVVNVLQAFAPFLLSSQIVLHVNTLGNLNSCVNPWIYILFNWQNLKKALCINGSYSSRVKENLRTDKQITLNSALSTI